MSKYKPRNEGEGSKTAAREYNKATRKFKDSGKVERAAQDAREAIDGPEGNELRDAEKQGKSRMKEEDPELREPSDESGWERVCAELAAGYKDREWDERLEEELRAEWANINAGVQWYQARPLIYRSWQNAHYGA